MTSSGFEVTSFFEIPEAFNRVSHSGGNPEKPVAELKSTWIL